MLSVLCSEIRKSSSFSTPQWVDAGARAVIVLFVIVVVIITVAFAMTVTEMVAVVVVVLVVGVSVDVLRQRRRRRRQCLCVFDASGSSALFASRHGWKLQAPSHAQEFCCTRFWAR